MWKISNYTNVRILLKVIFTDCDLDGARSSQAAIRNAYPIFVNSRSEFDKTHRAFHHATAPATKVM